MEDNIEKQVEEKDPNTDKHFTKQPREGYRSVRFRRSSERSKHANRVQRQSKMILIRSVVFALLVVGLYWLIVRFFQQPQV